MQKKSGEKLDNHLLTCIQIKKSLIYNVKSTIIFTNYFSYLYFLCKWKNTICTYLICYVSGIISIRFLHDVLNDTEFSKKNTA